MELYRTEITGQTTALKSGEVNPETYLPRAEASEARKEEYLNGNFDELLETKCG